MSLREQLATKELVVFLGAGGVGKTTVSAAAALEASRERRTLVLTIDPAKRLADAMGVQLGSDVHEVRPNLHALMLDTKKALDDLIEKYAPDNQTVRRIFNSRFYQHMSDAFAGSEEFVAMGTLYELLTEGDYDLIVVDTPPSKHAVDFLAVNSKLIRVFDSGVVKYIFKPTRFLRMGGGYMAKALASWTSMEYLEEVSDFVMTFDDMFLDMEERVRAMQRILHDGARTGINLVTSADDEAVPVTLGLHREVAGELGLHVDACVVNRYLPRLPGADAVERLGGEGGARGDAEALLRKEAAVDGDVAAAFLDDAVDAARFYTALADANAHRIAALQEALAADFHRVPALPESVHDMEGLERVRGHLFSGT